MRVRKENFIPVVISIMLTSLLFWIAITPSDSKNYYRIKANNSIQMLNNIRYDLKLKFWLQRSTINAKSKIVILNIYDPYYAHKTSENAYKYLTIKKLIKKLENFDVKAIATNIIISQSRQELIEDLDELLKADIPSYTSNLRISTLDNDFEKIIKNNNNIILPYKFNQSKIKIGHLPKPLLEAGHNSPIYHQHGFVTNFAKVQDVSKYNGFTTTLLDEDSIIRKAPLLLRYNGNIYPSLALSIAMNVKGVENVKLNSVKILNNNYLESIELGNMKINVDKFGAIFIPFNRALSNIKTYTTNDIMNNNFERKDLKNAIVLIAFDKYFSLIKAKDYLFAPTTNAEAQASVLSSILASDTLYEPYWAHLLTLCIIVVLGIFLTICFRIFGSVISTVIALTMQLILMLTNLFCFMNFGITLNFSTPLMVGLTLSVTNIIFGFVFESGKKLRLKKFFGQYIPPEYLNILLEDPEKYGFEGKSENLTVLFADIRNFTGISEPLDANSVKKLLNEFFTPMTSIILKYGGTIDKYVGDMIMAFFGAPIQSPNQHECAINCALEMLAKTKQMQKKFKAKGLPEVNLSIGLSSGLMNVGDMGSKFRRSYTVIGNSVNLGSRIQSATAFYGVNLIVSSNTCIEQHDKFVFRLLDKVKLKGIKKTETIYEVIGRKKSIKATKMQEIDEHHNAIDAYFAQNWELAIQKFNMLAQKNPTYKPYQIFLERSKHYQENPPPEDWDGAYTFTQK